MIIEQLKKVVLKTPYVRSIVVFAYRSILGFSSFKHAVLNYFFWLLNSREVTNFTYDLEANNRTHLISLISQITNDDYQKIETYFAEIENNQAIKNHVAKEISASSQAFISDKEVKFSRRLGWYALARSLKPNIIVETGVDKGLGACLLTAALIQNHKEGFSGKYYGTDINPKAGYLLSGEYSKFGEIIYGDSIESLLKLDEEIDLFINDSDHSEDYEAEEYAVVAEKLSENAILLSDNAHVTDKLFQFSQQHNRQFLYFQEKPAKHWYQGAGIGISFFRK